MSRTIQLNEIITSTRSKPVLVVVEKIVAVRPHSRGSNPPGSKIELVGGSAVRVEETCEEVERMMKGG